MSNKRTFVITDIHGMCKEFIEVLQLAKFDYENDELIFLGDFCDRGPDTFELVEELLKVKDLVSIRGNHDDWLLTYALINRHPAPAYFKETELSYRNNLKKDLNADISTEHSIIPKSHLDFLQKQVLWLVDHKDRMFCHAGFITDMLISDQDDFEFYWNRSLAHDAYYLKPNTKLDDINNFSRIFIGHTPTINWQKNKQNITKPIYKGQVVLCDTGACFGGKLSLLDITDDNNHILYQNT